MASTTVARHTKEAPTIIVLEEYCNTKRLIWATLPTSVVGTLLKLESRTHFYTILVRGAIQHKFADNPLFAEQNNNVINERSTIVPRGRCERS